MAKTPITKRGAELLRAELQRLKTVERPQVIGAIAEARAHGDLSENAEYDAARERQSFVEGRLAEVENTGAGQGVPGAVGVPREGARPAQRWSPAPAAPLASCSRA